MSNIFRDATEGTNAKRQDLLRRRRDEFVMMPHAIRRVFVARRARIAASLAVCLTGAGLIATALSPSLAKTIASGMPGLNPAVLSTIVIAMWVTGIVAYTWSRAMGEHAFLVKMSKTVMPSENLDEDVERLAHEHPDEVARGMAHRLEVRSAALPILAAGVLLPVTGLYAFYGIRAGGWPVIADFEASIAARAGLISASAVAGLVTGIWMTKRWARISIVAPIAFALALIFGILAIVIAHWFAVPAMLAISVAFIVWRLGKERERLDTEDPAAGSEVFTFKGAIAEVRAVVGRGRDAIRRASVKQLAVLAGLAFAAAGLVAIKTGAPSSKPLTAASSPQMMHPMTIRTPVVAKGGSKYKMEPLGDGSLRIEVTLVDDQPLDVPFSGIVNIPHGWNARVGVALSNTDDIEGAELAVSAFPGDLLSAPQTLSASVSSVSFSQSACDEIGHPIGLRVQSARTGTYTFVVAPTLQPAGC